MPGGFHSDIIKGMFTYYVIALGKRGVFGLPSIADGDDDAILEYVLFCLEIVTCFTVIGCH